MKTMDFVHFRNREEFRDWLKENHDKSLGIWMIYYKKHVKTDGIKYRDALEEALCFGWIDSIIKKIDDNKYVRKFTPRTDNKNWSEVNKRIVFELLQKGKMTEMGMSKIDKTVLAEIESIDNITAEKKDKKLEVPDFIIDELANHEPALSNFNRLAPSHKKRYMSWITEAKKEETVKKRIKEAIELLKENKKLGLK